MPLILLKPWFLLLWLLVPLIWLGLWRYGGPHSGRSGWLAVGLLRSAVVLLIALALADPRLEQGPVGVNVFFCLDASRSIGAEQGAAALARLQDMAAGMGTEDRAGLIVFGRTAQVELGLSHVFAPTALESRVDPDASNIHDALQLALGQLPHGEANRIVLLSDGRQNRGDALEMAPLARALDTAVYSVPLTAGSDRDRLIVDRLITPETAVLQTPFAISLFITSSHAGPAELSLLRDDTLLALRPIDLQAGKNVFHFSDTLESSGLYLYKALVYAADDLTPQNNGYFSFTRATRQARIGYLTAEDEAQSTVLSRALEAQGLETVRIRMPDRSLNLKDLLDFSAVILDNVPARSLSFEFMDDLSKYVRDMGGGLVMVGGHGSFGAGRFGRTPLEDALPVFMEVPGRMAFPGFALVLLIDKSASMAGSIGAEVKIEAAKKAAFSAVEMLNPTDEVGILAFDTAAGWSVPLIEAGRRREIVKGLSELKADGGTDLHVGLREAFAVLSGKEAARKHVIVLSDGLTLEADFMGLAAAMKAAGITTSTVALGKDADIGLMSAIAAEGGGRSYYAGQADQIPRIFAGETSLAIQDVIVEDTIQVRPGVPGEILKGLPADDLPPLQGMVTTYPKPGADVLLDTAHGPLLAVRTYGLGRSAAFTSDLAAQWGPEWVRWPHYGQFVAQLVKWTQRKHAADNYAAQTSRAQGRGRFSVDVQDNGRRFVNNLALSLNVLSPSKNNQTVHLEQVAPGRYEGDFQAVETGVYYLTLYTTIDREMLLAGHFGFAVSYSDEYLRPAVDDDLLPRLAAMTGGRVLSIDRHPADLFTAPPSFQRPGEPLWPFAVLAALVVFVADIALRKVLRYYAWL